MMPKVSGDLAEDIARLRLEGYGVDDDNDPAPDNLPSTQTKGECQFKEWNSQTTCNRRVEGLRYENPNITNEGMEGSKCIDFFLHFLPVEFFRKVILMETNNEIHNGKGGEIIVKSD